MRASTSSGSNGSYASPAAVRGWAGVQGGDRQRQKLRQGELNTAKMVGDECSRHVPQSANRGLAGAPGARTRQHALFLCPPIGACRGPRSLLVLTRHVSHDVRLHWSREPSRVNQQSAEGAPRTPQQTRRCTGRALPPLPTAAGAAGGNPACMSGAPSACVHSSRMLSCLQGACSETAKRLAQ